MKTHSSLLLASTLCLASSANAGVLFSDKFDERSFSGWSPSGNDTATIVNSPVRGGNYAAELKLDRANDNVSYRTELSLQQPRFEIGKEYWIGFSNQVPEGGRFFALQIHKIREAQDQTGRQPLTLNADSSNWTINVNFDGNAATTTSTDSTKSFGAGSLNQGQWTDWVIHIKFSFEDDGLLEVWKNGSQIVNYQGPNCYNDELGPYLKIGIYNPAWGGGSGASESDKRTIYYDQVTVGDADAGYDAVAP
ncbi:MAG: polysaccharide lyase [Gammaproteobacteria bacterium]